MSIIQKLKYNHNHNNHIFSYATATGNETGDPPQPPFIPERLFLVRRPLFFLRIVLLFLEPLLKLFKKEENFLVTILHLHIYILTL
jgi:hypothetical protein